MFAQSVGAGAVLLIVAPTDRSTPPDPLTFAVTDTVAIEPQKGAGSHVLTFEGQYCETFPVSGRTLRPKPSFKIIKGPLQAPNSKRPPRIP